MKKLFPVLLILVISAFTLSACTSSEPVPTETISQELQDQRKTFNDKRGNNAHAARTDQSLFDIAKTVSPASSFDVYVQLDADEVDQKKYELGGDEAEYKASVDWVVLSVVIDSQLWNKSSDDSKKDSVASWIKIMQNEYENSGGMITVSNDSRKVAEGTWSAGKYGSEPKIELK
jgi:anion-transporting  ArsA/GET3 family ATPase